MIKILYIITGLRIGGAERLLYWTCEQLSQKKDVHVEVIYFDPMAPMADLFRSRNILVTHVPYRFSSIVSLMRTIHKNRFNIVHTHLIYADVIGRLAAWMVSLVQPVQIFCTAHGTEWFRSKQDLTCRLVRFMDKCLSEPEGSRVLAISESVRDILIKNEKISPQKIRVLLNGIDIPDGRVQVTHQDNKKLRLLFLGRLSPEKNISCLIQAMHGLRHKPVTLSVVGDGRCHDDLVDMVHSYHLEKKVAFFNATLHPDEFLQQSDVLVLPSTQEGLGLVILEAFSFGLPVIGSDVDGIRELLGHGRGLLFKNNDNLHLAQCIERLLNDTGERRRLGRAGFAYVRKNHNIQRYADELYNLYRCAIRENHADQRIMNCE
jgi:glycosyltransferase involved in cell wall biosynthesis